MGQTPKGKWRESSAVVSLFPIKGFLINHRPMNIMVPEGNVFGNRCCGEKPAPDCGESWPMAGWLWRPSIDVVEFGLHLAAHHGEGDVQRVRGLESGTKLTEQSAAGFPIAIPGLHTIVKDCICG